MKKISSILVLGSLFLKLVAPTIHHEQWEKDAFFARVLEQAQASKAYRVNQKHDTKIEESIDRITSIEAQLRSEKNKPGNNNVAQLEQQLLDAAKALDGHLASKFYDNVTVFLAL
jgi:hypothetical protein